jgi:translocation and assembly module TamA
MKSPLSFVLVLVALLSCAAARAADPQPYKVELASVGNDDIDETLKATSDLRTLRTTAPVSPFGLIARARSDVDRLKTVLESFGYYESAVIIKINGVPLTDPSLGETLTALPKGSVAIVNVSFTLGTLYTLRRIDIEGEVPESIDARSILGLKTGQPAVAADVLAGGNRLQTALQEQGYAFARVDPPVAYEAADVPVLDLTFQVVTGSKATIGQIHIEGLQRVHERLLRRRLLMHTGDLFRPSQIERARRDLLALNVFGQVTVQTGTQADASGGVPINFKVHERPRHAVTFNAAFSSDLGGSGGATWTDRNVFGNAEQLTFAASVINLGGSNTTGLGYDTSIKYLRPEFLHRDQSLQFAVGALKQQLQAYNQTAKTAGVTLSRKLSSVWSLSGGLATTIEQITQITSTTRNSAGQIVGVPLTIDYTLAAVPLTAAYDSTNLPTPLDDPRHGLRGSLTVTPTLALGRPNSTFIITQLKVAAYFDLHNLLPIAPGRSVLAARTLAGVAQGAGQLSLPPDQRFYAGGSSTIRGFAYQSVGPIFPGTNIPTGGTAITAVGVEFRQRFGTAWGAAVFADGGQTSAKLKVVPSQLQVGAGAGLRYYTPIGPIRFDVALPINPSAGEGSLQGHYQFYIGLGQAF